VKLTPYTKVSEKKRIRGVSLILLNLFTVFTLSVNAQADRDFIRLPRENGQPIALEVAITSYTKTTPTPHQVDLIGAVHIGDQDYYDKINSELAACNTVLYELVAEEGARPISDPDAPKSSLYTLVASAKDFFGFVHQLDAVDYSSSHFVHADLSFDKMLAQEAENSKSQGSFTFRLLSDFLAMSQSMANSKEPELRAYEKLSDQLKGAYATTLFSNPVKLKNFFAVAMVENERSGFAAGGATLFNFLITRRNERVLEVLRKTNMKKNARIGIFYGAGHMKDMEEKLVKEGYIFNDQRWVTAWDLKKELPAPTGFSKLLQAFSKRGAELNAAK
jgi:hypothetical protein